MGMSGDYKVAIAEGSTMIRVGSIILAKESRAQLKNIIFQTIFVPISKTNPNGKFNHKLFRA